LRRDRRETVGRVVDFAPKGLWLRLKDHLPAAWKGEVAFPDRRAVDMKCVSSRSNHAADGECDMVAVATAARFDVFPGDGR
jgi:hypothetical protein